MRSPFLHIIFITFPRWSKLSDGTKRELLASAAMELPVLRYASRYEFELNEVVSEHADDLCAKVGVSKKLRNQVICLMLEFAQLQLDPYEQALIAALCATSPDRGISDTFDYRILTAAQVYMGLIANIKYFPQMFEHENLKM